jgi:hypothetical protein
LVLFFTDEAFFFAGAVLLTLLPPKEAGEKSVHKSVTCRLAFRAQRLVLANDFDDLVPPFRFFRCIVVTLRVCNEILEVGFAFLRANDLWLHEWALGLWFHVAAIGAGWQRIDILPVSTLAPFRLPKDIRNYPDVSLLHWRLVREALSPEPVFL